MPIAQSSFPSTTAVLEFVARHYPITPTHAQPLPQGTANCFHIQSQEGSFFLKEFQPGFDMEAICRELRICALVNASGIPTSRFLTTRTGTQTVTENSRSFHLQAFLPGKTVPKNEMSSPLLLESGALLGKINAALASAHFLPEGFPESWFTGWTPELSIRKHSAILSSLTDTPLADVCRKKLALLRDYPEDPFRYLALSQTGSHGDYNHLQLLCNDNLTHITAVIDFSSAARLPAVWEIIRSYSQAAPECRNGEPIDPAGLIAYTEQYLSYAPLTLWDVSHMAGFYYFHLLRSTFGLNTKDEALACFALWRGSMCLS